MFVEKTVVGLVLHAAEHGGDVALTSPTSPRSTAVRRPMCLGFLSIWTFFTWRREGILRRENRTQQQKKVGSWIAPYARRNPAGRSCQPHWDCHVPAIACRGTYSRQCLQLSASWITSWRASLQPSPPKIATVFASLIIFASLVRSASEGRTTGRSDSYLG